jgi:pyruvate/2-oxoglutarate dehydrogenase complex dihydrolipoamide dehydrogenase (E3) component
VGGAVFGFWWGLLLVSFASSIGATLAFLLARTILRDWVQQRFGSFLEPINRGMEKDGVFYLFTLRLVPLFPFFLVNLVMGLTPIRVGTFYGASQLGMLFGTALYVNVGAQLGLVASVPGVLSIGVIRAIVVLALFPWLARALVRGYRNRTLLRGFVKPKVFDTNLVVIGAGSAGLVTSYIAALAKARVTLVEKHRMGGDCLNTGCVPSKALLRSAAVSRLLQRADEFGLRSGENSVDFAAVMQRVHKVIGKVEPHDSVQRYSALGVDCVQGEATLVSPWCVRVAGRDITTRAIVIASGARPAVPAIPGLDGIDYLTSDTVWSLQELPRRLLVLGGGPIGCELAQAFARLGSTVTLVNRNERLLPREDADVSAALADRFADEGVRVLNSSTVASFRLDGADKVANITGATQIELSCDAVLVALGRHANVEGLGLERLGINLTAQGRVEVNEYLQTACPTVYACGDVAGPYQFTHMASFQAWFAGINALFGSFWRTRINYRIVPSATFTSPEVARVGLNEAEAQAAGIAYELSRYDLDDLDRAIADGDDHGFVKVLTVPGKDRILGVSIVSAHAAELLAPFTLAMTHGLGLRKIMGTIHVYPTFSESGKFVAGAWQRQHAPQWLYPWLERYHRWQRKS